MNNLSFTITLVIVLFIVILFMTRSGTHDSKNFTEFKYNFPESFKSCNTIGCWVCSLKDDASVIKIERKENDEISKIIRSSKTKNNSINLNAFTNIYDNQVWGSYGGGSGAGSDSSYAKTTSYILQLVILKYSLKSLLDAPCGGVSDSWTKFAIHEIKKTLPCFRYHGTDVVKSVIDMNIKTFSGSPWIQFSQQDLSSWNLDLPSNYDIILSRDALQHLSYLSIAGALAKYCRSDARYLLVGSYLDEGNNKNIESGGCFNINLLETPFSFPKPIEEYAEKSKILAPQIETASTLEIKKLDPYPTKYLLLYKLDDLCKSSALLSFISSYS